MPGRETLVGVAHQAGTTTADHQLLDGQELSNTGFTVTLARQLFIPSQQVYLPLRPRHGISNRIQPHDCGEG